MEKTQSVYGLRIALLIDFDNVVLGIDDPPGFDVELIVNALRARGTVVLGRAYGDWYRHNRHRRKLMEQGIELVETPVFGPLIKNSADIRIALDGQEIAMTQQHIDCFCLVSGDSDFLPLIKRIQYLGKSVIVIAGTKFTSELVRRNCNEYVSYENLLAESVGAMEDATTLDGAFHLLGRTIATLIDRGMEVRSSTVKQMMVQLNPVFSERNFGCNQFKQFLDRGVQAGIIKLGKRDQTSGEYTVLPADDDINGAPVVAPAPTEKEDARFIVRNGRPRRVRGRARSEKDDATPAVPPTQSETASPETAPEAEPIEAALPEAENAAEVPAEDQSAPDTLEVANALDKSELAANGTARGSGTLRRGRLRFSGRTWRSGTKEAARPGVEDQSDLAAEATPAGLETSPFDETTNGDTAVEEQTQPEAVQHVEGDEEIYQAVAEATMAEVTAAEAEETQAADTEAEEATFEAWAGEAPASDDAPSSETVMDEVTEEAVAGEASAETEEKPSKRRSRGGRRRRSATQNADADETETSDNEGSEASAGNDEAEGESGEAPAKKTRARRSSRRKTTQNSDTDADAANSASESSSGDEATASAEDSAATEQPARRTTRRRRTTRKKADAPVGESSGE